MHADAKKRVVDAVDALAAKGIAADRLALHPDYARELGLSATHLDLAGDAWAPSAAMVAAELTHPEYDARGAHDPHPGGALSKPKSADEAAQLGAARCQAALARPVTLAVVLDAAVPMGRLSIEGKAVQTTKQEA